MWKCLNAVYPKGYNCVFRELGKVLIEFVQQNVILCLKRIAYIYEFAARKYVAGRRTNLS